MRPGALSTGAREEARDVRRGALVARGLARRLEAGGRWKVETPLVRPDAWVLDAGSFLLQVVAENRPLPPFGLRIAGDLAGLEPGAILAVEEGRLDCGTLSVALGDRGVHDPRPDWDGLRIGPDSTRRARPTPGSPLPAGLRALLAEPLEELALAVERSDRSGMLEAVRLLAGRGPGLTPAGDDVLLGAVHALWCRGGEGPGLGVEWVAEAAPRTTRLSRAWLEAASRGEVGEVWRRYLESLGPGGRGVGDPRSAEENLLAWGATSGACSLAGFRRILEIP